MHCVLQLPPPKNGLIPMTIHSLGLKPVVHGGLLNKDFSQTLYRVSYLTLIHIHCNHVPKSLFNIQIINDQYLNFHLCTLRMTNLLQQPMNKYKLQKQV